MGSLYRPASDEQKTITIEEICVAECQILKIIDFNLEVDLPSKYIERHCKYMFTD